ncbi:MAG: single-stranded DNA-binding protein [Candidatus Diapherotrites archaeon]
MKVKDLKARAAVPEIELDIVSVGEERKFANERGSGRVANAAGKDDTGEIKVSLWNEQIDQVSEGAKIKIENGWVSEYQGQKQLSTGRGGTLTIVKGGSGKAAAEEAEEE